MGSIEVKGQSRKAKGFAGFLHAFASRFRGLGIKWSCFILGSCLLLPGSPSHAQTFDEWFKQNATQIKYLGLQIAALAQFEMDIKRGYSVAKAGLTSVGNFTGTEYGLHGDYFASLKAVSPVVAKDPELAAVRACQQEIITVFNGLPSLAALTVSEQHYVSAVKSEMLAGCGRDLEELNLVITPGKVEMTDDERLKRLHQLYLSVQDRDVFARGFCTRVALLVNQRLQEQSGINTLNQLYGID